MSFVWAAGLAGTYELPGRVRALRALVDDGAVGLIEVAWPAGPLGSGAIPKSIPAA
jgi:hypothetical protein